MRRELQIERELSRGEAAPDRAERLANLPAPTRTVQLKGEIRFDWRPEGLVCEIALRL